MFSGTKVRHGQTRCSPASGLLGIRPILMRRPQVRNARSRWELGVGLTPRYDPHVRATVSPDGLGLGADVAGARSDSISEV